jgi:hypothetical protein
MSNERRLGWLRLGGAPTDIGRALGRAGREAVHRQLVPSTAWAEITAPRHAAHVARLAGALRARFPSVLAEIEGLAEGLGLPFEAVMAWNSRGDLRAAVPDGCTTVMLPGETPVLAHNEDGLPFLGGACFIAEVAANGAPGFRAFCYPGSIPGHTFAWTDAGLVQTVNNLRLTGVAPEVPRMAIGRALLAQDSLAAAEAFLRAAPKSGGFHFALTHRDDRRILSVEFGGGETSVSEVTAPALHANHALRHRGGLAAQIVTRSSADRQARGDSLVAKRIEPLAILRDTSGPGLPIHRTAPDDPDDENTLATALFRVEDLRVEWRIHDDADGPPAYAGTTA